MNHSALLLVLISCVSHAAWNLLAKQAKTTPTFFWLATVVVVVAAAPVFCLWSRVRVLAAPPVFWLCLLLTGIWQAAYYYCLSRAYRAGDISTVYPLARSSPLFVIPLAGLLEGEWPTWLAAAGIGLVVAGGFFLPRTSLNFRTERFAWKHYTGAASRWALATALASSGYTVTDAVGVQSVRHAIPGLHGAFLYGYLEWVSTALWLGATVLRNGSDAGPVRTWVRERRTIIAVGGLIFLTYFLVLWAYSLTKEVASIAGMRQCSVVLGVLGGIFLFQERGGWPRMLGAAIIVGGLILIALAH